MSGLTLNLELTGANALLVGGGSVAARKAVALQQAGMRLTVIAPELSARLEQMVSAGDICWHRRVYASGDLAGVSLVVAATADRAVNRQVAAEARELGLLVNVADAPQEGNCSFPALLRRGALEVAVTTGGLSPAFSVVVRDLLAEQLDESYGDALELLAIYREKLLTLGQADTYNAPLIKSLLADGLIDLLRKGDRPAADTLVSKLLSLAGNDVQSD